MQLWPEHVKPGSPVLTNPALHSSWHESVVAHTQRAPFAGSATALAHDEKPSRRRGGAAAGATRSRKSSAAESAVAVAVAVVGLPAPPARGPPSGLPPASPASLASPPQPELSVAGVEADMASKRSVTKSSGDAIEVLKELRLKLDEAHDRILRPSRMALRQEGLPLALERLAFEVGERQ